MKLKAQFSRQTIAMNGDHELTFVIPLYQTRFIKELNQEKNYSIEIREIKSKRSLQQNKLFWLLMNELEKHSDETSMQWYVKALMEANCQYEYIVDTEVIEKSLKVAFRACVLEGVRTIITKDKEEKEMNVYKVFIGSSKFNTKEMTELIEIAQRWCAELNINLPFLDY